MDSIEERIQRLDTSLFSHVDSQSTDNDKRTLLALQAHFRVGREGFTYLEIGSYMGGSLQSCVVDGQCQHIVSIDPRPRSLPDDRGVTWTYEDNSTQKMISLLAKIPGADVGKIHPIDAGTDSITPQDIPFTPDLCFIDGEHTDESALRDARFCLSVVRQDGCIFFHDAQIVYKGIDRFLKELVAANRRHRAFILPDSIFIVDLSARLVDDGAAIRTLQSENYQAYLYGMMANDRYREILSQPVFRFLRNLKMHVYGPLRKRLSSKNDSSRPTP
jgi:hypothetical protein